MIFLRAFFVILIFSSLCCNSATVKMEPEVISHAIMQQKNKERPVKKAVLVIGGAGYIGSHAAWLLHQQGYQVVILDAFVHEQVVDLPWATVIRGDFGNPETLKNIFTAHQIDSVMHFAAFIEVGESVKNPSKFYNNNVLNTIKLLDAMRTHKIDKIIFSSSCAVYGDPIKIPMNESHPFAPVSPYGRTKLAIEFALKDYATAYGIRSVALRYFNASGSLHEQNLGEQHKPETHIIPLLLRAAMHKKPFYIFGTDYPTPDGSCVRDYIHVLDIARAHILAAHYLERGEKSDVFNLGVGKGYSVKELISVAQKVTQTKISVTTALRRAGDAHTLIADDTKIKKVLGWVPEYSDLETIIKSAYIWEKKKLAQKDAFEVLASPSNVG